MYVGMYVERLLFCADPSSVSFLESLARQRLRSVQLPSTALRHLVVQGLPIVSILVPFFG